MLSSNKVQKVKARSLPSACFVPAVTEQTLIESVIGCRHHMQKLKLHPILSHSLCKVEKSSTQS